MARIEYFVTITSNDKMVRRYFGTELQARQFANKWNKLLWKHYYRMATDKLPYRGDFENVDKLAYANERKVYRIEFYGEIIKASVTYNKIDHTRLYGKD